MPAQNGRSKGVRAGAKKIEGPSILHVPNSSGVELKNLAFGFKHRI